MKAAFILDTPAATFRPWLEGTLARILDEGVPRLDPARLEVAFQDLHEERFWTHFVSREEQQAMLHDDHYDWGAYWNLWERPHYWRACNNHRIYRLIFHRWEKSETQGEIDLYTTLTRGLKVHRSHAGARRILEPCVRFDFMQVKEDPNKVELLIRYQQNPFGYDFPYPHHEWESTIEPADYFLDELAAALSQFNPVVQQPKPKSSKENKLAKRIGRRPAEGDGDGPA